MTRSLCLLSLCLSSSAFVSPCLSLSPSVSVSVSLTAFVSMSLPVSLSVSRLCLLSLSSSLHLSLSRLRLSHTHTHHVYAAGVSGAEARSRDSVLGIIEASAKEEAGDRARAPDDVAPEEQSQGL